MKTKRGTICNHLKEIFVVTESRLGVANGESHVRKRCNLWRDLDNRRSH